MAVPGYHVVNGPVATDSANGATAYNSIAAQTEANYPKFNWWTGVADAVFPTRSAIVRDLALFTPAAGWAFEALPYREAWGKKFGGCTFISLSIKRTGASLASKAGGNLSDVAIGTLAAGYRPLSNVRISAICTAGGLYQITALTTGVVQIYSAAGVYGFPANRSLQWAILFANNDLAPF